MSDGTKTFSYDSNGNMLSDGLNLYAYNYDNRMISAGNAEYSYNSSGIRTEKTVNSETTKYIVDMNESYPRVVEELDSFNNLSVRYEAGEKIISHTIQTEHLYQKPISMEIWQLTPMTRFINGLSV